MRLLREPQLPKARLVDNHGPDGIWEVWWKNDLLFATTRRETAADMVEKINTGRDFENGRRIR